jgi:hypothetical protein
MPTIQLTNNTTLNITASSADGNATLNRYLKNPLTFLTPKSFDSIANEKVADLDANAFPIALNASGTGKFAVEGTTLGVTLGASGSLGLLKGDSQKDCLDSLQMPVDPAAAGLVSFKLQGTLSVGDTATAGYFTFGITDKATVTLTSFCEAAAADTFAGAVQRAVEGLTIPHDIDDLKSLPAGAICQIDAASSLQFTASVTYNVLNDPLATKSIAHLPPIAVKATAGATLEATVTHTSDHTVTIGKMPNGHLHWSVSLTRTDDFETSLTASAGLTAKVGSQDALAFLLDKISPNSAAEMAKIKADIPEKAQQLSTDIKAAIDASLCKSLQVSLKTALDDSKSTNRLFLYDIDLTALDQDGVAGLQSALKGDFTGITGKVLAGVTVLDAALTVTSKVTHTLAVHLLGIFNFQDTNTFIEKSKVDYTKDTHEIVLSDESVEVVTSAKQLREAVVKGITFTLPASANTPAAASPINMVFFDYEASTSPSTMRQFVNALLDTGAASANAAQPLLAEKLHNYGASSLFLGLNLTPTQCRSLFIDGRGKAYDWTTYLDYACKSEAAILNGDADNADRLKLFTAGVGFWKQLDNAGSGSNITLLLRDRGIGESAVTDALTLLWWSQSMAAYAQALASNQPVVDAAKNVVKDGTRGYNEPWLVLTAWNTIGHPTVDSLFTCSLLKQAMRASQP